MREAEKDILVGLRKKKSNNKSLYGDDKIAQVGLYIYDPGAESTLRILTSDCNDDDGEF